MNCCLINNCDFALFVEFNSGRIELVSTGSKCYYNNNIEEIVDYCWEMVVSGFLECQIIQNTVHDWIKEGF
jgi:hypothetical protein